MIPEEIIEEIKRRNDIVSVVEQYVPLTKKSGANFFGLCPFHGEDTPSFSVSPSKQIFYCFGCHKGGDVVRFIQEIEKLTYPESLRFLAEKSGIAIEEKEEDPEYKRRKSQRDRLRNLYEQAARFFYHSLNGPDGVEARAYCDRRGLKVSTLRKFGIGYAPAQWDALLRKLKQDNPTLREEDLRASKLFSTKKQGSGLYDLFRDRLMFPVFDERGQLIAFGGRILKEGQPKYINSPETPLYVKGQHLYALNWAKRSTAPHLLLLEGYMDVIAAHAAGFDFAVGALGTALTLQQTRLLRRMNKEVIVGFDADEAGQRAILRSLDLLEQEKLSVRVLLLPDGKDVDEYIRNHGAAAFELCLQNSLSVLEYKFLRAKHSAMRFGRLDLNRYWETLWEILAPIGITTETEKLLHPIALEQGVLYDTVASTVQQRHLEWEQKGRPTITYEMMREQEAGHSSLVPEVEAEPSLGFVPTDPDTWNPKALDTENQLAYKQLLYLSLATVHPEAFAEQKDFPPVESFSRQGLQELYQLILTQMPDLIPYQNYEQLLRFCPHFSPTAHRVLLEENMRLDPDKLDPNALPYLRRAIEVLVLQQDFQELQKIMKTDPEIVNDPAFAQHYREVIQRRRDLL